MPNNKLDRFTQKARRVLSLAQAEAEQMLHSQIGTEHLLLGLMREEGGVGGRVLRDLGLSQRHVVQLIDEMQHTARTTDDTALDLSPRLKHVIELAIDEARRMGHHYIGTEHLLLALVRERGNMGVEILTRCNIMPEAVRRQTRKVLQEGPGQPDPQPAETTPTQPARISAAINSTLHLSVTDTLTGTVNFEFSLPIAQVENLLDTIYDLIDKGEPSTLVLDDPDHAQKIEIILKNDAEKSSPGASDGG